VLLVLLLLRLRLLLLMLLLMVRLKGRPVGKLVDWFTQVVVGVRVVFGGDRRVIVVGSDGLCGMWDGMRIDVRRQVQVKIVVQILLCHLGMHEVS
jgi:hypothetical protein